MNRKQLGITYLFFFIAFLCYSQELPQAEITFDFNDNTFKEKNNRLPLKAVGASLVSDRFGNKESAVRLNGHLNSYLNLGTSKLLKPKKGTISLWVNIDRAVRTGRGAAYNPIIVTKNSENHGWYNAYTIGFELGSECLSTVSSLDSLKSEAIVIASNPIVYNKWYHLAISFDNDSLFFYIDGKLQNSSYKGFETMYLESDSVVVGHAASKINERFTLGIFDDIQIYHSVLSPSQIKELFTAPNPNALKRKLDELMKYGLLVLGVTILIIIMIYRNKQKLKKQREQLELNNRITELEMQVVKTQMNPHFISNCLAAIQDLIFKGSIDRAGQYLAKFSLFMRQVLNYSDKTFITLSEELELIKLNIELEQLRFSDNFEYNVRIANDVDVCEVMIPSLITQPIIENAIWHGLLPIKEKRKPVLNLFVYQKEDSLLIEIKDNGVGRNINSIVKKNSKGTQLIRDRLESLSKLSGSKNYKISIKDIYTENEEALGTTVIIELDNQKF